MKVIEHYSEWNEKIQWCINSHMKVCKEGKGYGKHKNKTTTVGEVFISEGAKTVQMIIKEPGRWKQAETYVFYLDGEPDYTRDSNIVAAAMRALYKCWRPSPLNDKEKGAVGSASPVLGYNKEKSGKRYHDVWEYDLKSAYSWGMLQDLPDVDKPCRSGVLEEEEIGFNTYIRDDGARILTTEFEAGKKCRWIFKSMKSPYKEFVEKYYAKKENATSKREKAVMKAYLNVVVGQLQNVNPFVRACIVNRVNKRIEAAIDENTLMWNTDAIVSLGKRDDLPLGDGIGEWSIKHSGDFAYIGSTYQWNDDIPGWRGIPKVWFPKNFDILKDEAPVRRNLYTFSWETGLITENEEWRKIC